MNSIIKAIKTHPHWGVRLFDQEYNKITDLENTTYFMSEVAFKSFSCRVSESIQTISMNILITFLSKIYESIFGAQTGEEQVKFVGSDKCLKNRCPIPSL